MERKIIITIALLLVVITVFLLIATREISPTLRVVLWNNTSLKGYAKVLPMDVGGRILVSRLLGNETVLFNIYVVDQCKITPLLMDYNGIITGSSLFEYNDHKLLLISSLKVGEGGTRGELELYDLSENEILWSLKNTSLYNITAIGGWEPGFIFAGLDSSSKIHVVRASMTPSGIVYVWNKSFKVSMPPQEGSIFLSYSPISNTVIVGAGRSLIVLDYGDGSLLLNVKDIGGIVRKLRYFWNKYLLLVDSRDIRRVVVVYGGEHGLWDYRVLYNSSYIVDAIPVIEENEVIVAEGLPLSTVYSNHNNTSGRLIALNSNGDILSEALVGDTVVRLTGYTSVNSEYYVLVDYAIVNGSRTTFYTSLLSLRRSSPIWKYSSLNHIRSFIDGSVVYVIEYRSGKSFIQCYGITWTSK